MYFIKKNNGDRSTEFSLGVGIIYRPHQFLKTQNFVTFYCFGGHIYEGGREMDLEKLYHDYFSVVYKYILSISKDSLTAEEITQETFFKALKKIDEFRGDCSVRVWLCQIAKNTYYNYTKKQARFVELKEGEESSEYAEYDFLASYHTKAAHRILHNMKEPYKEVFSLRVFGELSFSDIGELFGKSDSWARVTFHRARLMIKEELENGNNKM